MFGKLKLSCDIIMVSHFYNYIRWLYLNERISNNNHPIGILPKIVASHDSFQSPKCGGTVAVVALAIGNNRSHPLHCCDVEADHAAHECFIWGLGYNSPAILSHKPLSFNKHIEFHPSGNLWFLFKIQVSFWIYSWWNWNQIPIWYVISNGSCTVSLVGFRIGSQMQEPWGANPRLGRLRASQFQTCGGISALRSRASGLQSATQGNSIRTTKKIPE